MSRKQLLAIIPHASVDLARKAGQCTWPGLAPNTFQIRDHLALSRLRAAKDLSPDRDPSLREGVTILNRLRLTRNTSYSPGIASPISWFWVLRRSMGYLKCIGPCGRPWVGIQDGGHPQGAPLPTQPPLPLRET